MAKESIISTRLELKEVVSHWMWMLGTNLEYSGRAGCTLNHLVISPAPFRHFYLVLGSAFEFKHVVYHLDVLSSFNGLLFETKLCHVAQTSLEPTTVLVSLVLELSHCVQLPQSPSFKSLT